MKEKDYYNEGKWAGLPNYECKQCKYATLDKGKMLEHIATTHFPLPEPELEKVDGGVLLPPVEKKQKTSKAKEVKKDAKNSTDTD